MTPVVLLSYYSLCVLLICSVLFIPHHRCIGPHVDDIPSCPPPTLRPPPSWCPCSSGCVSRRPSSSPLAVPASSCIFSVPTAWPVSGFWNPPFVGHAPTVLVFFLWLCLRASVSLFSSWCRHFSLCPSTKFRAVFVGTCDGLPRVSSSVWQTVALVQNCTVTSTKLVTHKVWLLSPDLYSCCSRYSSAVQRHSILVVLVDSRKLHKLLVQDSWAHVGPIIIFIVLYCGTQKYGSSKIGSHCNTMQCNATQYYAMQRIICVALHSRLLHCIALHCIVLYLTVISADPNCSFPYTYNGGLYYSCTENMTDVSTTEQPLACMNVIAIPIVCDSPGTH